MLNHIFAALNDYALAFNQDEGNYSYISSNIGDLTGYNCTDFKKNTSLWFSLIDARDIKNVEQLYDGPIAEDGYTNLTYRIATAQGKIKWVNEKRCVYADEKSQTILLSIIKDIQREEAVKYNPEESYAGYSILFDKNPSPMCIYEVQTLRILKVNEAAIKTYGYLEDEFLSMTLHDLRPKVNDKTFDLVDPITLNGFKNSGVLKHMNKNGDLVYAEISGDSICYRDTDCRIIVATNITEKIYYQEEVKVREQFLNSLIDSQTNFLIRIDTKGNYTFVNKRFTEVFGYKKEDIIGKHFHLTTIPEESYLCEEAFLSCINNTGKVVSLIHKKPAIDGKLYDTEWEFITITNDNGEVIGIQGVGQDITDKINAQKEIVWTKNSLEALTNYTDDLIWSVDHEYRYLYINKAYKKALVSQTGVAPKKGDVSLHGVFGNEVSKKWEGYYDRAFKGESYILANEIIDTVNGDHFSYEISFNPIYNAEGGVTGVGCFARDISERIKTNNAIIDQNERLQNIASLSSHELRRPVATMLGLINIIDTDNFHSPDNMEIINHLLVVGREIDDVIRLIVNKTFISHNFNN